MVLRVRTGHAGSCMSRTRPDGMGWDDTRTLGSKQARIMRIFYPGVLLARSC
jgi:hypothetical protein